jgi:hypothetical protein
VLILVSIYLIYDQNELSSAAPTGFETVRQAFPGDKSVHIPLDPAADPFVPGKQNILNIRASYDQYAAALDTLER